MSTELRPYQEAAVQAVYRHLATRDDHPCVVIPTGGGKTPVIARICREVAATWNGRALVLAHVKELLEQSAARLQSECPLVPIGVYSAGLGRRDTREAIIVAGIQSVYQRADELGRFDVILIDEAHLLPADGEGMYRTFLAGARAINPNVRLVGLTATPFRLNDGPICGPDHLLNHVCFEVGVRELIRDGYLSRLVSKAGRSPVDMTTLHVRGGEFIPEEVERLVDQDDVVRAACAEIMSRTKDREACLIFAAGVDHAKHVVANLRENDRSAEGIFGDTPSHERDDIIRRFRRGDIDYLVNVNVLTTGFDSPNVDTIALLRPTMSPGLYYQMVGRGFRLAAGKTDCLILDFGGNVVRHGPVDGITVDRKTMASGDAPAKECPECQTLIASGYAQCPECGYQFPPRVAERHEAQAGDRGLITGDVTTTVHEVLRTIYSVHLKRGSPEDAPKTMRVEYQTSWRNYQSEWICVEHEGWARQKAEAWWRARSHAPLPLTAAEAVAAANEGVLCTTTAITVRSVAGEPFDRIIAHQLGDKPLWRQMGDVDEPPPETYASTLSDDQVPF